MERVEVDIMGVKKMHFSFPESPKPGKIIIEIDQLSKSYGDKKVIQNLDFQIDRGDRLAFVGQNGQGKTTLVKCNTNRMLSGNYKNRTQCRYELFCSRSSWVIRFSKKSY